MLRALVQLVHEPAGVHAGKLRVGKLAVAHDHDDFLAAVTRDVRTIPQLFPAHFADRLDVSVASATGIVDRMEDRGLVERLRDPGDRRVVLVHPTEAGNAVFGEMAAARRQTLEPLLDRMTDDELQSLLVGFRALRRVRSEMAELAGGEGRA